MLEAGIQRAIILEVEKRGGYVARVIKASKAGTPDLICCYRGHFLGLEVKTKTGKPSELQKHHLKKIGEAGGVGAIVRSVDDVRTLLEGVDNLGARDKIDGSVLGDGTE